MAMFDAVRLALWVFCPVLVLGGAWVMVAIVRRWLAVKRVRQYQMKLLDKYTGKV